MINCNEFNDRLADYLGGELEGATLREVEAHLESCSTCAERSGGMSDVIASLHALPVVTREQAAASTHGLVVRRERPPFMRFMIGGLKYAAVLIFGVAVGMQVSSLRASSSEGGGFDLVEFLHGPGARHHHGGHGGHGVHGGHHGEAIAQHHGNGSGAHRPDDAAPNDAASDGHRGTAFVRTIAPPAGSTPVNPRWFEAAGDVLKGASEDSRPALGGPLARQLALLSRARSNG